MPGDDDLRSDGDPILGALYNLITGVANGEFSVSLLVGGHWLTGMAINGRTWLTQLAATLDLAPSGKQVSPVVRQLATMAYPTDDEVEAGVAEEVPEDRPLGFIHLRDARLIVTGGATEFMDSGRLVRCRFGSIDAWMLGNQAPDDYRPPLPIA